MILYLSINGVYLESRTNMWLSQIQLNHKTIYIGKFKNELEAALAYDEKAKKLFGQYAKTNF